MRRAFVMLVAIAAASGCVRMPGLKPVSPDRNGPGGQTTVSVARAETRRIGTSLAVRALGMQLVIYDRPVPWASVSMRLASTNDWGQALWFPVVERRVDASGGGWFHVRLPIRPNGSLGWVRAPDVSTRALGERIEVDLSEHRLRRYDGRRVAVSLAVGTGASSTPTPTGHFFVWASISSNPSGPYGAYILGLSGFSRVIRDGRRMAIHGTEDPSDRGHDVSEGCVRVYDAQLPALEDVPLGTPVWIHG
jgi:hypothetical protein